MIIKLNVIFLGHDEEEYWIFRKMDSNDCDMDRNNFLLVLINGKPQVAINPSRGLCQLDPLSPYLFILHVIGLISIQEKAERERMIKGT
jgi:hypothetical protein